MEKNSGLKKLHKSQSKVVVHIRALFELLYKDYKSNESLQKDYLRVLEEYNGDFMEIANDKIEPEEEDDPYRL